MTTLTRQDLFSIGNALAIYYQLIESGELPVEGERTDALWSIMGTRKRIMAMLTSSLSEAASDFHLSADALQRIARDVIGTRHPTSPPRPQPIVPVVGQRYRLHQPDHPENGSWFVVVLVLGNQAVAIRASDLETPCPEVFVLADGNLKTF